MPNYERETTEAERANLADQDDMRIDQGLVTRVLADLRAAEKENERLRRDAEQYEWNSKSEVALSAQLQLEQDAALAQCTELRIERDALQSRLTAAESEAAELLDDMAVESPELADDERMSYVSVQISRETYEKVKARRAALGAKEG